MKPFPHHTMAVCCLAKSVKNRGSFSKLHKLSIRIPGNQDKDCLNIQTHHCYLLSTPPVRGLFSLNGQKGVLTAIVFGILPRQIIITNCKNIYNTNVFVCQILKKTILFCAHALHSNLRDICCGLVLAFAPCLQVHWPEIHPFLALRQPMELSKFLLLSK